MKIAINWLQVKLEETILSNSNKEGDWFLYTDSIN